MGSRRSGRIAAMQILYQMDARGHFDELALVVQRHFEHVEQEATPETRAFAERLCEGVVEHLGEIDDLIEKSAQNWRLARMNRVDRNVLRLASYELAYLPDVPVAAVINEAVELGKTFGATESSGFINGVLDRVAATARAKSG